MHYYKRILSVVTITGRDYKEHENHMLVAVTELRTKEEIDTLVNEMGLSNEEPRPSTYL